MSHLLTTNKTKPVPNGKMARIMTHCHAPLWEGKRKIKNWFTVYRLRFTVATSFSLSARDPFGVNH